jgi:hypothetical protein
LVKSAGIGLLIGDTRTSELALLWQNVSERDSRIGVSVIHGWSAVWEPTMIRRVLDWHDELEDWLEPLTWAPNSLQSKVESWVAATPIVTVFLCSVERRFSVPAIFVSAVTRSLGRDWPQATGEAGAQRS